MLAVGYPMLLVVWLLVVGAHVLVVGENGLFVGGFVLVVGGVVLVGDPASAGRSRLQKDSSSESSQGKDNIRCR